MAEATLPARTDSTLEQPAGRRRPPVALVALIAASLLLALVWALVSPPFQAPDENSHYGYAETLAVHGSLPGDPARAPLSTEQVLAGSASNADQAAASKVTRMEWDPRAYDAWLALDRKVGEESRRDGGGGNPAASNPPLYYLFETAAYLAAGSSDVFGKLLAMRIVSLLWLAVTVAGAWLLAGEIFGRDRLLQLVAASVAGLAPMMTFISASVSPDSMLFALWTLALWLGVRILRRGLTAGTGAGLFALVGLAVVVKATSYALLPGALLVLAVGLHRRGSLRSGLRPLAASLGALAATVGGWFIVARVLDRAAAAQVSAASTGEGRNLREMFSYAWQFYLPRLPFMTDFPSAAHTIAVYDIWFKGTWAAFGWTEVQFRNRIYILLLAITLVVVAAAAQQLWRSRAGADRAILAFLVLVVLSLLVGLHWSEYQLLKGGSANFNQGRYLLPLVGIAGLILGLAVRRVPQRRRATAVAAVLGGFIVLQAASLGLVLERFYA